MSAAELERGERGGREGGESVEEQPGRRARSNEEEEEKKSRIKLTFPRLQLIKTKLHKVVNVSNKFTGWIHWIPQCD